VVLTSLSNTFDDEFYHIWLAIIDSSTGAILHQYAFPNADESSVWHLGEMPNVRGYLLPGTVVDPESGEARLWLAHIDTNGQLLHQRWYDLPNYWEEAFYVYTTTERCYLAAYLDDGMGEWRSLLLSLRSDLDIDYAIAYELDALDWLSAVAADTHGHPIWIGVTTDTIRWNMDASIAYMTSADILRCPSFEKRSFVSWPANLSVQPLSFVRQSHPAIYLPVDYTIQHAELPTTWSCRPTKTQEPSTPTPCNELFPTHPKDLPSISGFTFDALGRKIEQAFSQSPRHPLLYFNGLRGRIWGRLYKQRSSCPEEH